MLANNIQVMAEGITLREVEKEIDPSKPILDDGPRAHIDFLHWLVKIHYDRLMQKVKKYDEKPTLSIRERALANAKVNALTWLMSKGHDMVDRSTATLIAEASDSAWYSDFEWSDVEDMLRNLVEADDRSRQEIHSWTVIYKKIMPACQVFGIDPGLLAMSSYQIRKARFVLPSAYLELERQMQSGQITTEEAGKTLHWLLEMAADPKTNMDTMREQVDEWRGIERKIVPLKALHAIVMGKSVYIIPAENSLNEKVIENALRGQVVFETVGTKTVMKFLTQIIEGGANANQVGIDVSRWHDPQA